MADRCSCGRRVSRHGLPLPQFGQKLQSEMAIGAITPLDVNGRLADRAPLRALGWTAGDALTLKYRNGVVVVERQRGGQWRLTRQGHLLLPVPMRRRCLLAAGDRALVLAYPDCDSLLVLTMGVLEAIVTRHADEQRRGG